MHASSKIAAENSVSVLYQASVFDAVRDRVICGFTGKPFSMGGPDCPDNPRDDVLRHRFHLLTHLGENPEPGWLVPEQVHGRQIGVNTQGSCPGTDVVIVIVPNSPVMLLFADCVPVILYDPIGHIGAVIHAGWRGTAQAIVKHTVETLKNDYGVVPKNLLAAVGPAIGFERFQVSRDVALAVGQSIDLDALGLEHQGLLAWDEGFPDNPRLDLKGVNALQLRQAGVTQVEILPNCTLSERDRFFSHRGGDTGRNSAFMFLNAL